jgi:hypothetical protein
MAAAAFRACAARRWRSWPASASRTTPGSSAGTCTASPTACSRRSPAPCSSTKAERAYLFDLARALRPTGSPRPRRALRQRVRPSIQHVLDALTGAAAIVHNARLDNLAANQLGYALYSDMFSRVVCPAARDFYLDWDRAARDVAARAPLSGGPRPLRPRPLRPRRRALHPELGVPYPLGGAQCPLPRHRRQGLPPPRRRRPQPHLQPHGARRRPREALTVWTAEPGTRSAEALSLLGSWAATPDEETTSADHEGQPRHSDRAE